MQTSKRIDLGMISLANSLRKLAEMQEKAIPVGSILPEEPGLTSPKPTYNGYGTGLCFDCSKTISRNKCRCMACQVASGKLEDRQ